MRRGADRAFSFRTWPYPRKGAPANRNRLDPHRSPKILIRAPYQPHPTRRYGFGHFVGRFHGIWMYMKASVLTAPGHPARDEKSVRRRRPLLHTGNKDMASASTTLCAVRIRDSSARLGTYDDFVAAGLSDHVSLMIDLKLPSSPPGRFAA